MISYALSHDRHTNAEGLLPSAFGLYRSIPVVAVLIRVEVEIALCAAAIADGAAHVHIFLSRLPDAAAELAHDLQELFGLVLKVGAQIVLFQFDDYSAVCEDNGGGRTGIDLNQTHLAEDLARLQAMRLRDIEEMETLNEDAEDADEVRELRALDRQERRERRQDALDERLEERKRELVRAREERARLRKEREAEREEVDKRRGCLPW